MPNAATFELDARSAARMDQALVQSIGIEKRSAVETITYFMIRIMQSGRSRTKLGKKFREIKQNPEWSKGSKEAKYVVVKKLQPTGETLLPKYDKGKANDPRVLIKTRGLAKSSWGWGLKAMGKTAATTNAGRKYTTVQKMFTTLNPSILLQIGLQYIDKVHPGIVAEAMTSAINYILKRQEQKLEKQLQQRLSR